MLSCRRNPTTRARWGSIPEALLHTVILRADGNDPKKQQVVFIGTCTDYSELDGLMKRFRVDRCVIDGLPEIQATRAFVRRHRGKAYMCFFSEHQHGAPKWNHQEQKLDVNRTEALDLSRVAVRDKALVLPRRDRVLEEFAAHLSADAKVLEEDEKTGVRKYRYIKTGVNHYSFAFTYAWLASQDVTGFRALMWMMRQSAKERAAGR
jgi:hypothetical protein